MRSLLVLAVVVAVASAWVVVGQSSVVECEMCKIAVRVAAPALGKDVEVIEKVSKCFYLNHVYFPGFHQGVREGYYWKGRKTWLHRIR